MLGESVSSPAASTAAANSGVNMRSVPKAASYSGDPAETPPSLNPTYKG